MVGENKMVKVTVTLNEEELRKLRKMAESGDAASISHAVRKCIDKAQREVLKA